MHSLQVFVLSVFLSIAILVGVMLPPYGSDICLPHD